VPALPSYVYLGDANHVGHPGFLGKAHEAYVPGQKAANLGLFAPKVTLEPPSASGGKLLARRSTAPAATSTTCAGSRGGHGGRSRRRRCT